MKLRISGLIMLLVAVPAFAGFSFDDLVEQGRTAFLAADLDSAETAFHQACAAEAIGTYPVTRAVSCEKLLAMVDESRGNLTRAEQRYLRAVAVAEQAGPAYQPLYWARLIDLGEYYRRSGRTTAAEAQLSQAVGLARKLAAMQRDLLPTALIRLGGLYADSAQPERGRAPLREALGMIADSGVDMAYGRNALGMIDLAAGHLQAAEAGLREAVTLAAGALGEDHPATAMYQTNLALALMVNRQYGQANLLLRRAEFVIESKQKEPSPQLGMIYAELSTAASAEGHLALAADFAERAVAVLNQLQKPDTQAIAAAHLTLASAYLRDHNVEAVEKFLPGAVALQRRAGGNPSTLAAAIQLLAQLREQQGNRLAAEALYREAIGIYESNAGTSANPAMVPALRALASLLKHKGGSKVEIRALEERARVEIRALEERARVEIRALEARARTVMQPKPPFTPGA